jgi:hydrogenase maturation protein HypF
MAAAAAAGGEPGIVGHARGTVAAAAAVPRIVLDARATVAAVQDDLARGAAPGVVSARFHGALAHATAEACELAAGRHGLDAVVLSGGAFQNRVLLERTSALLDAAGLRVLFPRRLPPNDGGIAFGQAAVASAGRPLHPGGVASRP